jgi:NDP-sugar pyrophosphorylase family protein
VVLRALVLAAGLGTRLRPLTNFVPKPLLPVGEDCVTGMTLRRLAAAGCQEAALNLHHLPKQISGYFGASWAGMALIYSFEAQIQGTLGALWPLRDFLGQADAILLVNGDSLCDWPFAELLARHRDSQADATLLLRDREADLSLGGGIGVDDAGRVTQLRAFPPCGEVKKKVDFAGAHVLAPRLLERLAPGPGDIISSLYQPLLAEGGRIATLEWRGPWHDLGTPSRYLEAWLERAERLALSKVLLDPTAEIERGAKIERSIVFPNVRVPAGCELDRVILGPGVALASGTVLSDRLVVAKGAGHYEDFAIMPERS